MASKARRRGSSGANRLVAAARTRHTRTMPWTPISSQNTLIASAARRPPEVVATIIRLTRTRIRNGMPKIAASLRRPATRWPRPGAIASRTAGTYRDRQFGVAGGLGRGVGVVTVGRLAEGANQDLNAVGRCIWGGRCVALGSGAAPRGVALAPPWRWPRLTWPDSAYGRTMAGRDPVQAVVPLEPGPIVLGDGGSEPPRGVPGSPEGPLRGGGRNLPDGGRQALAGPAGLSPAVRYHPDRLNGEWPSGKAPDSGSGDRRFESFLASQSPFTNRPFRGAKRRVVAGRAMSVDARVDAIRAARPRSYWTIVASLSHVAIGRGRPGRSGPAETMRSATPSSSN